MNLDLAKYGLTDWPFREVPQPTRCTFLAGRPALRRAIEALLPTKAIPVSSIHLFWASLGAGKTHALYYLNNRAASIPGLICVYTEYPEEATSFHELYRVLAQRIDWDLIADSCLQLFTNPDRATGEGLNAIRLTHPDLYRALFLIAETDNSRTAMVARRWLRGDALSRKELGEAGLSRSLENTGDCAAVIATLVRLNALKHPDSASRLIWIIDECQRLQDASARSRLDINAGLHSAFNASPDYFTLLLSFTGKPERDLPNWLRPEIADRMGHRNVLLLPPFDQKEAAVFLADLLRAYRTPNLKIDEYSPFTSKAISALVERALALDSTPAKVTMESRGLRPRALIKMCHAVLHAHLEDGGAKIPIDEAYVSSVLGKTKVPSK